MNKHTCIRQYVGTDEAMHSIVKTNPMPTGKTQCYQGLTPASWPGRKS